MDFPHIMLREFGGSRTTGAGALLSKDLGLGAIRFNSFGFYSYLGHERTLEIRAETHAPNRFPWFPIEGVPKFAGENGLGLVLGLNPEDGVDAAVGLAERLKAMGAIDRILAIEIGNEPHLSKRPWQPEDYGTVAARITRALQPYGLRTAVSLTVGDESKTPTGLTDDEYARRTLAAFAAEQPIDPAWVYGVIHLYGAGVDPATIDRLSVLCAPHAAGLRFLVTEYNIRSSLKDNAQLTDDYGIEFIVKTGRLVADDRIAGLFAHGFPFHAVAYWIGDAGIATVSGYQDLRLAGAAAAPGWHLTPAGRMLGLCAKELWRGELVSFDESDGVQVWVTRLPNGEPRVGVINAGSVAVDIRKDLDGAAVLVQAPPRSCVVSSASSEIARVVLVEGALSEAP